MYSPVQTTPFSRGVKIKARLWKFVWLFLYRPTPWFMYKFRCFLLNVFGARVSYRSKPANSSMIEFPWNLTMNDYSSIGERSWIYCLDNIHIGEYSCIGQDVRLITGSHNFESENFEMITGPITIGKGCWLTSDVTVLMGCSIGDYTVVGVRSLVTKDLPENIVALGIPARPSRKRFASYE
jgi:putative colanic acid biosynthesis acetyltransferase WcaF